MNNLSWFGEVIDGWEIDPSKILISKDQFLSGLNEFKNLESAEKCLFLQILLTNPDYLDEKSLQVLDEGREDTDAWVRNFSETILQTLSKSPQSKGKIEAFFKDSNKLPSGKTALQHKLDSFLHDAKNILSDHENNRTHIPLPSSSIFFSEDFIQQKFGFKPLKKTLHFTLQQTDNIFSTKAVSKTAPVRTNKVVKKTELGKRLERMQNLHRGHIGGFSARPAVKRMVPDPTSPAIKQDKQENKPQKRLRPSGFSEAQVNILEQAKSSRFLTAEDRVALDAFMNRRKLKQRKNIEIIIGEERKKVNDTELEVTRSKLKLNFEDFSIRKAKGVKRVRFQRQ
eukprot:maker-scaffold_8-snap-gene-11.36-mRNA-1 protein AED:0.01 eAED:0.01 QI:72/1/1/1/1/1/4/671/339